MANERFNELVITFADNGETGVTTEADITAPNIVEESMKLVQSINGENYLKFGGCIASEFSIDLLNTDDRKFTQNLVGRWISVKLIEHIGSGNPLLPSATLKPSPTLYSGDEYETVVHYLFSGKIDSATLSNNDFNVRRIIAYDVFADLHAIDATNYVYQRATQLGAFSIDLALTYALGSNGKVVIPMYSGDSWYSTILNEKFDRDGDGTRRRIKEYSIKNSSWFGKSKTITFGELLRNLCEDVATFGIIVPDSGKGSFKMITLAGSPAIYQFYENLQAEEFISTGYTGFTFAVGTTNDSSGEHALGGLSMEVDGSISKNYDFLNNVTLWETTVSSTATTRISTPTDRLINTTTIGYRLAMNSTNGDCAFDTFRPLKATVEGVPNQIVGQPITIVANKTNPDGSYVEEGGIYVKESINTYVFKRTLSGIQALTDEIEAKGQR